MQTRPLLPVASRLMTSILSVLAGRHKETTSTSTIDTGILVGVVVSMVARQTAIGQNGTTGPGNKDDLGMMATAPPHKPNHGARPTGTALFSFLEFFSFFFHFIFRIFEKLLVVALIGF